MNFLIGLIFGVSIGAIISFFSIILFAKKMDKKEKDTLIKKARDKYNKDEI